MMRTIGGLFVALVTTILTGVEIAVAPPLSVAFAVREWLPPVTLLHVIRKGLFVTVPNNVAPAKKSTRAIVPSLSEASALMVISAPAVNAAFSVGLRIATVGGLFASSFMIVPMPCPRPIRAWVGLLRFTKNVSSGSFNRSPRTWMVIVLFVSPGSNVSDAANR